MKKPSCISTETCEHLINFNNNESVASKGGAGDASLDDLRDTHHRYFNLIANLY